MIQIKFKDKNASCILYHLLLNVRKKQKNKDIYIENIKAINDWCLKNISICGKQYSFPAIIKAGYDELVEIANICETGPQLPNNYKKFIINLLYKARFPREKFVEELKVTVCPYCNRNYINSTNKRTMCDLDHFFNKDTYPILAVSFYNLVPVCHACNHAKQKEKILYSPHDLSENTDNLLSFGFNISGMDFLTDATQIGIEIDCSNKFMDNAKVLKLKKVYQIHSDVVQECIKKTIMFNPQYLKYLYHEYRELFESEKEFYRIIYGNYLEEISYGKRPLSKMTKDILSELLLGCYEENIDFLL